MPIIRGFVVLVLFIIGATLILSLSNCSFKSKKVGEYYCSDLIGEIYGKESLEYRGDDFHNYPFEKQYAIFICGNQYIHPPTIYMSELFAIYVAKLFAKEGNRIVAFLKMKLLEANDDLTIRDLILVFSEMSRLKTYDVASDDELMRLMFERVEGMKSIGWKEITLRMLAEIQK
ncbi:MAG: hypothetical protein HQK56_02525 [Deltaproteobacteria bacterium]|nr:hypothetical protein [Deltaproteobacteria bacterium]